MTTTQQIEYNEENDERMMEQYIPHTQDHNNESHCSSTWTTYSFWLKIQACRSGSR